jgi:type VI secretion system protein ImpA
LSPPTVEFDRLLAPVSESAPAGTDLRADQTPGSLYYRIKDARNAARAVERQLLLDPESVADGPDWSPVLKLAPDILAENSKDLEIVAWYVEALVRRHGIAGLRDGFRLARELCERYWDGLFPQPDEEGLATRVAPLTGLNGDDAEGTLIAPIRGVPLTGGRSSHVWGAWEYEKALELDRLPDPEEKQRRITAGAVSMQMFEAAVRETGKDFFLALASDVAAARAEYGLLGALLDEKCGEAAPPASNVRAALDKFEETMRFAAPEFLRAAAAAPGPAAAAGATVAQAAGSGGPLQNREDAFRQLEAVSEYFRRTEPHSPLSYTLQQAVRWGRMPLPDLLTELIPDETTRGMLFRMTGIRGPDTPAAPPPQG